MNYTSSMLPEPGRRVQGAEFQFSLRNGGWHEAP
ncbi:MAG: hypothetical protein QOI53_1467 [Verrucomicrobiota bacterium]|jgi:hypothetical protein|nr:hypothetical protein [Verrucomicrobiota bacterium]